MSNVREGVTAVAEPKNYIGVTIGPIYDTLMLTSTPAGLWGASYLFSSISRELCGRLGRLMTLVSPYYDAEDPLFHDHLGVGLLPDHLIFEQGEATLEDVRGIVDEVKDFVADLLCASGTRADETVRDFYRQYLQIHTVAFAGAGNPILDSAQALDAIELERSFPAVEKLNPILACLELPESRGTAGRNDAVKNSRMVRETIRYGAWQLLQPGGGIRDLEDIAGDGIKIKDRTRENSFKKYAYYAIVQSDGDSMSNVIKACGNEIKIREFSQKCLKYASDAAQKVRKYGGVTIYAGGDDLLFIAPVENREGGNIFGLMEDIRGVFAQTFGEGDGAPTVSFGMAVCYYKFPLYEAFSLAVNMLFGIAKKEEGKNALALTLQKHSGQTVELVFPRISGNECLKQITGLIENLLKADAEEKMLSSAVTHLRQFEALFTHAVQVWKDTNDTGALNNAFKNTFDAGPHSEGGAKAYLEGVKKLMKQAHLCRAKSETPEPSGEKPNEAMQRLRAMDGMLRLIKFYLEKGREES